MNLGQVINELWCELFAQFGCELGAGPGNIADRIAGLGYAGGETVDQGRMGQMLT